jgi:hypothetical protein
MSRFTQVGRFAPWVLPLHKLLSFASAGDRAHKVKSKFWRLDHKLQYCHFLPISFGLVFLLGDGLEEGCHGKGQGLEGGTMFQRAGCFYRLQLGRREISLRQMTADMASTRHQYQDAVEENGRLEARIQAFTFSAQSEQDLLAGEVKRREDAIVKLKNQQIQLQETIGKQEERVSLLWLL